MRSFKSLMAAAFALLTFLALAPATLAHAQFPAYLHAISDLRTAREYLKMDTRPHTAGARDYAIKEISRAIVEMKNAARDDGKNPDFTPPPQSPRTPACENAVLITSTRRCKPWRHSCKLPRDRAAGPNHSIRGNSTLPCALLSRFVFA